jgi:peptidyl-prolyl cis-trans isomerase B (cyclophilin B)
MSSVRDRQRAAVRARMEREMAQRAEAARRKRRLQARIGAAVAGVVIIGAAIWIIAAATGGSPVASPSPTPAPECIWTPLVDPSASPAPSLPPGRKDVGLPPNKVPRSGYQVMTVTTNLGVIKVEMDLSKAPCTAASMAHLAEKKFFDGSGCHRLAQALFALQCGDPSGSGSGGPTYAFMNENVPAAKRPPYHEGDVAMANSDDPSQPSLGTNGSQFFFIYANPLEALPANYTLLGHVIEGLDIVKKVAAGGDDGAFEPSPGGGHPKTKLTFISVTMAPPTDTPAPVVTPPPTTAAPSTSP